jgi:hypothetical protein
MHKKIITIIGAAAAAAAFLLPTGTASAAAVPDRCQTGPSAGFCGTQKSDTGLRISVGPGYLSPVVGLTSPKAGTFIGAYNDDWLWLPVAGSTDNAKIAEWAPDGILSGEYLTETTTHQVTLAGNPAAMAAQWTYTGGCGPVTCDGPFANEGSGRLLAVTTNGGPVVTITTPATIPATADFTFTTP